MKKCIEYLLGIKAITPFRVLWPLAALVGAVGNLGLIWIIADTLNAMMAIPNLIALLALSPVVFRLTKEYWVNGSSVEQTNR